MSKIYLTQSQAGISDGVVITDCKVAFFFLNFNLVGLVVKASASRAENPGSDSRLRRVDVSASSHTSDVKK